MSRDNQTEAQTEAQSPKMEELYDKIDEFWDAVYGTLHFYRLSTLAETVPGHVSEFVHNPQKTLTSWIRDLEHQSDQMAREIVHRAASVLAYAQKIHHTWVAPWLQQFGRSVVLLVHRGLAPFEGLTQPLVAGHQYLLKGLGEMRDEVSTIIEQIKKIYTPPLKTGQAYLFSLIREDSKRFYRFIGYDPNW
eukprot:CAMPEP_0181322528 /NCGR_PEP_ID=MMETSP1101-20121128/19276_1 /TAXON_ID=46948 /ORGANISM="Rhodomonas abbreviata, Strain Caron Lab Isolate" /LENGTH=190 /DNA_ID=CAMNT_0023430447 /DNA_START=620 /DNA_END=1189 /DNA_ORIENTATION=+